MQIVNIRNREAMDYLYWSIEALCDSLNICWLVGYLQITFVHETWFDLLFENW